MTIGESLGLDDELDNTLVTVGGPEITYPCVLYSELNKELFHVTPEGRVIKNGVDITNDDTKMTQCFIDFLAIAHNVQINV